MDPVTLGLCTQIALDMEVSKAAKYLPKKPEGEEEQTLIPAEETQTLISSDFAKRPEVVKEEEVSADSVFANFPSSKEEK